MPMAGNYFDQFDAPGNYFDQFENPAPASVGPNPEYDPSAGGGTLQVQFPFLGTYDTGIKTPESVDRFLAGTGKAFVDFGRGFGQMGEARAARYFSPEARQLIDASNRQEVADARALDAPLMRTGAGVAGNVTGNLALTAPLFAVPGANTIPGSALIGAGLGAAQPVAGTESRAENATIGGIAGGTVAGATRLLGRVVQPIRSTPKVADARAVATLDRAGVPMDAAQRTGSPVLQRVKSSLTDNPVTVGGQVRQAETQQAGFNQAVLEKIGVNADVADEATMGQAYSRIGQVFDDVLDRTSIRFNTNDATKARVLEARARRVLGDDPRIANIVRDISEYTKQNGGKVDGRFYQTIRRDIAALEKQPDISPIARELRETLDDAFQRAATPDDAAALQEARRQWRNMRLIESAVAKDGSGNISPSLLANQFGTKANRSVGVYGKGDVSVTELARLAKAGKRIIPDKLPNSGTVPRALMQAAAPAAVGAAAGGYKTGDWTGVATGAVGGVALPLLAQGFINSPAGARYLTQGLFPSLRAQAPQVARNALFGTQALTQAGLPAYLLTQPSQ